MGDRSAQEARALPAFRVSVRGRNWHGCEARPDTDAMLEADLSSRRPEPVRAISATDAETTRQSTKINPGSAEACNRVGDGAKALSVDWTGWARVTKDSRSQN